ncbi:MAG: TraB/GumN family protein [Planctomycetes bacterium]|nr:TraB/GumN family protein [Planctomycetota bacterium]
MLSRLLRPMIVAVASLAAVFPVPAAWIVQEAAAQEAPQVKAKLDRPEHAFIWKVEKEGHQPSFLFGTMHVPDKRFLKFNDTVKRAFKESDGVYTELDMDLLESVSAEKFQEIAMYKGKSLKDVVPAESYEKLSDIVTNHFGMPMMMLDGMRPFMASMTLEQLAVMKHYGAGQALDQQIWNAAKKSGKDVGGVETLDEQFAALSVLTDEEALGQLVEQIDRIIEDIKVDRSRIAEMAEIYLGGSEEEMLEYVMEDYDPNDPVDVKQMYALLDMRNVKMADRSGKIMRDNPKKSYVFAFGTLHMIGDNNVAELLRQRGFKVTRMTAPPKRPKKKVAAESAPMGR